MLSNYLAEIWGISMVVVCLTLLIKPKYLKILFTEVENEATMLFWGIVSFIIGLAVILAHNIWIKNWQVIITILGWMALAKGLSILFLPDLMKSYVKRIEDKQWLPIALVIGVFIGLIITYFGFTA